MKKNNTAEKTVQDAKRLTEALKESTKKSLKDIMSEAIENIIKEDEDTETDDDLENSYEEEDVETDGNEPDEDETVEDGGEEPDEDETVEDGGEEADADDDAEDADDEWSDMEDFKVGDNVYDFTSLESGDEENDDLVLKVYNKLGDDDQIIVKKEDDGSYSVTDDETGAEYVIELGADAEDAEDDFGGEDLDDTEFDVDIEDEPEEEADIDLDLNDEPEEEADIELDVDDDDEEDELNEENNVKLFTKGYQKDVMPGLKMNEPAPYKRGKNMDAGLPKGTERPYEKGYGDGDPFKDNVNECGQTFGGDDMIDENGSGFNSLNRETKNGPNTGEERDTRLRSRKGKYYNGKTKKSELEESAKKIYMKAKQIQEENKKYKEYIEEIKKSLTEAAVLNVSLTQALKLLAENTTSAKEKKAIIERFNGVKTIKESKQLYETIKSELNESKTSGAKINTSFAVAPKNTLNETTIYGKKVTNPSLDLMNRMENLYK